ncbi:MAG: hypothetical protein M0R80_15745, partial [Proteobacteria bacterium]|nr:hypothetical protein [Pseudomonadota bacterium]
MIRSTAVLGITLSTLLSISCTSSPRSFDDAGSPDAGDDDAIPGWRLAWAVRAGGDEHELSPAGKVRETGQSIAALSDGSSYLGGQVAEAAVFGPGESNEAHFPDEFVEWSDGFVARYYPDGSLEWVRRVGGNGEDHVFAVVALEDGSVLVAGWFRSDLIMLGEGEPNETILTTEYEHTTGFVAKFEPDGAIAWATQIPTTEETRMDTRNVDALPDGRILVGGSLRGTAWPGEPFEIVSETSDSPFEWDGYLAWFDANGTVEHAIRIGNDSYKTNHSIAMLPDGSVIAAMPYGYSELFGRGEPNETTLYCPLQQDANDCSSL